MKPLLFFFALSFILLKGFSQGRLSGKITDSSGEALYGVVVRAEENTTVITQSDFDGIFLLKFPDDSKYTLRFFLVGYDELYVPFSVNNDRQVRMEFTLSEKVKETDGVEIVARARRSSDSFMEKKKMNSALTLDYISSETIKKTGDSNVINAIARVSGVSTNGGLITVRGIGDRYVRTTMNGSRIPTLDPLTNNIQLDMFPNSLVDNIIITKTASPDLPGDWSGAYISVETRDFPDRFSLNIETQIGYNPQNTFKDFITSDRSSSDWMGFDNGLRSRNSNIITPSLLDPTTYDQFVALGLGNYFDQMGVTGWSDGSTQGNLYFRLGLVQLGLLSPAQVDDPSAYQSARDTYFRDYKPAAIQRITPDGTNYDNGFSNNWDIKFRKAPVNFSQSFSLGNEILLFGRSLGFFGGFRYGSTYRYDPDGISQRVGDAQLGYPYLTRDHALLGRETNGWSALLSGAYALGKNTKLNALFMPNFTGTNDVASYRSIRLPEEFQEVDIEKNLFYEQRRQLIYQMGLQHYIPSARLKIDYHFSYTDGQSVAPDFKATEYIEVIRGDESAGFIFGPTAGNGIRRYYRYLDENILDTRVDFEYQMNGTERKLNRRIKAGAAVFRNYRKTDNYEYRVMFGNNWNIAPLITDDIDAYMSAGRFTVYNGIQDFNYASLDFERNHSFGNSNVYAAYAMIDYEWTDRIRFSGGLRAEQTDLFSDVDTFHQMGYDRNDPRRENTPGFPLVNPAGIKQLDFLPSGNLIFKFRKTESAQTNIRLSYSRTLARPSIREVSDAAVFDNEFRTLVYGNSDLKVVYASNYDVRAETYFTNGDNVSLSFFYKDIINHIEMGFGSSGITWENIRNSSVRGVEIEGKKRIGERFELRANVTLVHSQARFIRRGFVVENGVKNYINLDTLDRPMYGQAPYLVNAMASYRSKSGGFTATVSYNIQGPRLVIAGVSEGRPDVYELPRNVIDIKMSKMLGEHFALSLTVRDVLNARVSRSYDLPRGWDYFDSFRYGTNFLIGFSYTY